MRIVILGAAGQVGNFIFRELKKNTKYEVIGTSRSIANDFFKFNPFKDNWHLLGKVDILINCVGQINETNEFSFDKIHQGLTYLIIKNRNILENPKIIQMSALGASSKHVVNFLKTKGIADEYLLQFSHTIVVRPSIICTHRTMMVKKMLMLFKLSKITNGILLVPKYFLAHKIQPVMPGDITCIISALCESNSNSKIINIVGPDQLSFRELIELMFEIRGKRFKIFEISKRVADFFVKYLVSPLFSVLINDQQYKLLFIDNIADKSETEKHLGRPLASTINFWKEEFK